jgi:branched-chain amino acid aminotransferase
MGVFETLKVLDSHPEFLDRHIRRLIDSAHRIGIPLSDPHSLRAAVAELISANQDIARLARLRITVTEQMGASSVLISMGELQPWPLTTSCVVCPWIRNERSPLSGIKSTSYAENVLALNWAKRAGYSDAIFFNSMGFLAEGATTNIFIVANGEVLTPSSSSGLLPGVIRGVILDANLAKEVDLRADHLDAADEIFLTSSTRGVHPVERINDRIFESVGETTRRIIDEFKSLPN